MTKGFTHESARNESMEWYTPAWVFERLCLEFDLDPCHPKRLLSWVPAATAYTKDDDGLIQPWFGRVWLNPPYGPETTKWLAKMHEHRNGIALVFARTDTKWFHDYVAKADAICLMEGRVRFVDAKGKPGGSPGAGSMLVAWGDDCVEAVERGGFGLVVRPRP